MFEVKSAHLCLEVCHSVFATYGRQCHFHHHLLLFAETEYALHGASLQLALGCHLHGVVVEREVGNRLIGLQHEIHLAHRAPAACVAIAFDGVFVDLANVGIGNYRAHAVLEVNEDVSLLALREGVAVQAHACGGCEFCLNIVAVEHHRVVVGVCLFGLVAII